MKMLRTLVLMESRIKGILLNTLGESLYILDKAYFHKTNSYLFVTKRTSNLSGLE